METQMAGEGKCVTGRPGPLGGGWQGDHYKPAPPWRPMAGGLGGCCGACVCCHVSAALASGRVNLAICFNR
ncbi:hypothetical protein E2C01_098493 [Portunus trituberculatus]|uniref:Uncharacterized protein n=1 Tax=Portunus trituberculatus TaxID=210409 RepID=A0A5B7K8E4_PORTR|nr:hypothetical protein [Portunus trituberculatus]